MNEANKTIVYAFIAFVFTTILLLFLTICTQMQILSDLIYYHYTYEYNTEIKLDE